VDAIPKPWIVSPNVTLADLSLQFKDQYGVLITNLEGLEEDLIDPEFRLDCSWSTSSTRKVSLSNRHSLPSIKVLLE
jgi:hypothetical protein